MAGATVALAAASVEVEAVWGVPLLLEEVADSAAADIAAAEVLAADSNDKTARTLKRARAVFKERFLSLLCQKVKDFLKCLTGNLLFLTGYPKSMDRSIIFRKTITVSVPFIHKRLGTAGCQKILLAGGIFREHYD